jgi:hypothetical protein
MRLQPTALLKTLTGKTVVALLVVTSGVGAAAAAGADVPLLTPAGELADDGEPGDDGESDDGDGGGGGGGGDGAPSQFAAEPFSLRSSSVEDEDEADEGEAQVDDANGDEERDDAAVGILGVPDGEVDEGEHPDNHGEVVSTFARDNPLVLEGCERGQATAAVARGDVDPGSATLEADLADHLAKCDGAGESEELAAVEDEATATTESDIDWQTLRDEGREAVHLAQQSFVEACGDGDGSGETGEAGEAGEADGAPMMDECRALLEAAKDAREAWKLEWKTARDDAKGRDVPPLAESGDAEPAPTGKPEKPGKPEDRGKPGTTGKPEKTGKP